MVIFLPFFIKGEGKIFSKNLAKSDAFIFFIRRGSHTHSGTQGAGERVVQRFHLNNIFLKPKVLNFFKEGEPGAGEAPDPLLKPPPDPIALAGARPINTQKVLRLKISNSLRSNSEIFLTSPNFLLTTLKGFSLLAKFTTV